MADIRSEPLTNHQTRRWSRNSCLLLNPKVHHRVYSSTSVVTIFSQMNPINTVTYYFFEIQFASFYQTTRRGSHFQSRRRFSAHRCKVAPDRPLEGRGGDCLTWHLACTARNNEDDNKERKEYKIIIMLRCFLLDGDRAHPPFRFILHHVTDHFIAALRW